MGGARSPPTDHSVLSSAGASCSAKYNDFCSAAKSPINSAVQSRPRIKRCTKTISVIHCTYLRTSGPFAHSELTDSHTHPPPPGPVRAEGDGRTETKGRQERGCFTSSDNRQTSSGDKEKVKENGTLLKVTWQPVLPSDGIHTVTTFPSGRPSEIPRH